MEGAPAVKTILCIPGNWKSRSELIGAIAENNVDNFLFAGQMLMNLKTKAIYEIELHEKDDQLRKAFKAAGMVNRLGEDVLDEIEKHTHVVYVIGETGTPEKAKAIAEAGNAILKAGGTGLKVETTGKAFAKEKWMQLVEAYEEANLYQMFVIDSISDGETVFSCGMQNVGLKDTILSGEEFQEAVNTISIFGYYQLIDKPVISANQTFSISAEAPVFRITDETEQPYADDELFENPFGMWRLKRV